MKEKALSDQNCEFRVVGALSICFGLVGLDRFAINPLFPVIATDLALKYSDIGLVSAAVALTWGAAAIFMGRLADRVGVKTVLVPAVLAFSALAALSGVTGGLASLLLVRGLMGLAEGTFVPACIVATTRVSKPWRVGMNVGLLHMALALFGLGLAPLLVTQLLKVLPSWHWVFAIVAAPGVLMAHRIHRVLPTDPPVPAAETAGHAKSWQAVVRQRPIRANILAMSCWLGTVTTLGALLPSYLTDHLGLTLDQMAIVLSAQGLGGVMGLLAVPMLGDRFGHLLVALVSAAVTLGALALFSLAPGSVGPLFALLLVIGLSSSGPVALTVGPLTGRAVEASLASTATGLVVGGGEIFGGALAPAMAGALATQFGIGIIPLFALGMTVVGSLALASGRVRRAH